MTARKDWLTTKNRLVTLGETGGIQERLEYGCEGLAAQHTVPVREHHSKLQHREKSNTPRVFREGGG